MNSDGRARHIYKLLVDGMRQHYRDARPKNYFTKERLDLTRNDELCWAFLRDLDLAAQAMGLKGFVLCLDEFEDILYNLTRIDAKKKAFWNLFELFHGHQYKAHAYFAVTPGFAQKCKQELARKGEYDYDFSQFDAQQGLISLRLLQRASQIRLYAVLGGGWQPEEVRAAEQ